LREKAKVTSTRGIAKKKSRYVAAEMPGSFGKGTEGFRQGENNQRFPVRTRPFGQKGKGFGF